MYDAFSEIHKFSTLLVIISFTARLFVEEYIDMVIQVNVTVMLALATMLVEI